MVWRSKSKDDPPSDTQNGIKSSKTQTIKMQSREASGVFYANTLTYFFIF